MNALRAHTTSDHPGAVINALLTYPHLYEGLAIFENEFVPEDRVYVIRHSGTPRLYVHDVVWFRFRLDMAQLRQDARDEYDQLLVAAFPMELIRAASVGYHLCDQESFDAF